MGGGASPKTTRRPHEPEVFLPEGSALLGDLEAHARTVQSPCRAGLGGLPVPRSTRRRTEGKAQRNVQARPLHKRGPERATSASGASSTIAQDAERVAGREDRWALSPIRAKSSSRRAYPWQKLLQRPTTEDSMRQGIIPVQLSDRSGRRPVPSHQSIACDDARLVLE
jgi:hypothetical protein